MAGNLGSLILQGIPQIPLILRTAVGHTLGWTDMSHKWDLRQEVVIRVLQSVIRDGNGPKRSISESQRATLNDPGIKGNKWISKYTIPKPSEDDVRQELFAAIDALKEGDEEYTKPTLEDVSVEWTGYRKDCGPNDPEPKELSENEKYQRIMAEVTSDVVILYFHGGAYYLMDPATHRHVTSKLAELTGGRAYSVRYRLAPQGPFPSALLDAFISYLSLLHPPPGAPHDPIPADKIVISGDSAGGNLASALLQLLLQLHRSVSPGSTPSVQFHGTDVPVPLPAGVALNSPWCDMTSSMDSIKRNFKYDYLPNKRDRGPPPTCSIWPSAPARLNMFAESSALTHQLVSPIAAKSWESSPPVYYMWGDELLTDEGSVMACKMAKDGVKVVIDHFETMPHCFALLFGDSEGGKRCFASWAGFCTDVVQKKELKTVGKFTTIPKLEETDFKVEELMKNMNLDDAKIGELMRASRDTAVEEFERKAKQ
jgi:acetyl esterase/lipase